MSAAQEHEDENENCWCRPKKLCGECLSENCAAHTDFPLIIVHRDEEQ